MNDYKETYDDLINKIRQADDNVIHKTEEANDDKPKKKPKPKYSDIFETKQKK